MSIEIIEFLKQDPRIRTQVKNDIIEYNKQSLVTQSHRGKELVAITPVVIEAIKLMGEDIVELNVENDILRDKISNIDEEWLKNTKTNIILGTNNESKNKIILERMRRQIQKSRQLN